MERIVMYCLQFHLYSVRSFPLFCSAFYERIAELYELPDMATLMKSLNNDVTWPNNDVQVYYLENMKEQNDKAVFQLRFAPSPQIKNLIALFLSTKESQVQNITVQFPARGDRAASSRMISILKSLQVTLHVPPEDVLMEIEGFMEMGQIRFIRETRLSGFVWIDGIQRYLHVSEDPLRVKEVMKDMKRL